MGIRTRVILQIAAMVVGVFGAIFTLDYFFPNYGVMIYWIGFLVYILYSYYQFKVSMLENERKNIINILKE